MIKARLCVVIAIACLLGVSVAYAQPPAGCETCPPTTIVTGDFTGPTAGTQLGRIFRDGIPSVCPTKAYPGNFNPATTYNYETFTYHNFGPAACTTVNWDPNPAAGTPCGVNAHGHLYASSYDPGNQGANFLGDVGSSDTLSFSATVPADSDFVVVSTNTAAAAVCDYQFEVVDVPCQTDTTLCELPTVNPLEIPTINTVGIIALILLLLGAAVFMLARRTA